MQQRAEITDSWKRVSLKCKQYGRSFGFFVFERIFSKQPELLDVFKMEGKSIYELADDDHFLQHARLFTNLIDLAVSASIYV
jgi:hypothetical protein